MKSPSVSATPVFRSTSLKNPSSVSKPLAYKSIPPSSSSSSSSPPKKLFPIFGKFSPKLSSSSTTSILNKFTPIPAPSGQPSITAKCKYCGKGFTRASVLNVHLEMVHRNEMKKGGGGSPATTTTTSLSDKGIQKRLSLPLKVGPLFNCVRHERCNNSLSSSRYLQSSPTPHPYRKPCHLQERLPPSQLNLCLG